MHATLALPFVPSYVATLTSVVSAVAYQSSGTAPVEPGLLYCGHAALPIDAPPAPVADHLTSFAPALPPNVMVFHTGDASVPLFHWLLMVVKSAAFFCSLILS